MLREACKRPRSVLTCAPTSHDDPENGQVLYTRALYHEVVLELPRDLRRLEHAQMGWHLGVRVEVVRHVELLGWGLGSKLRQVVDIGRQRETVEDGGSLLLRVCRASTHEQETLEAIGSNMK